METFSTWKLVLGNPPVTGGGLPSQRVCNAKLWCWTNNPFAGDWRHHDAHVTWLEPTSLCVSLRSVVPGHLSRMVSLSGLGSVKLTMATRALLTEDLMTTWRVIARNNRPKIRHRREYSALKHPAKRRGVLYINAMLTSWPPGNAFRITDPLLWESTGGFRTKVPVMPRFDFFVIGVNKLMNKQTSCQWFDRYAMLTSVRCRDHRSGLVRQIPETRVLSWWQLCYHWWQGKLYL